MERGIMSLRSLSSAGWFEVSILALIVSTLLRLCLLTIQLNDPQTLYFEVMLKMGDYRPPMALACVQA
jgi:hypothetical protein